MSEKISEIILRLLLWFYHVPLTPCVETPEPCKVTVLAPHVDDETIGCGGVLRQHVLRGDDVTVIFVTDGSRSSQVEDLVLRREEEGRKAVGQMIGVKRLRFWRYPDRRMSATSGAANQLISTLKELDTDILYVPSAWDLHPDHVATARLADAAASYVHQMIRIYEIFCPLSPKLLNRCIDISNVFELKTQATEVFRSQHVSFTSALLLNRVQSAMAHRPKIRAVESFLEIHPSKYAQVVNVLANTAHPAHQVNNYRNVLYAYLANLYRASGLAKQLIDL